jgi:hypothetical protein
MEKGLKKSSLEIFRFYEIIFQYVFDLGLISFRFDAKSIKLIAPIRGVSSHIFKFNWYYMSVFNVKNLLMILAQLFPKGQRMTEEITETGDKSVVVALQFIWLLSGLAYWVLINLMKNHQDEWKDVLSMWIRMENYITGKVIRARFNLK